MGEGDLMSFGRDRVFLYASLEELKQEYTTLLKKAKEISLDMEREIKSVSSLEFRVPSNVKSSTLRANITGARIEKHIFDDLTRKLNTNIDHLLSNLPRGDSISSDSMSKLTEGTRILTDIINEYREFVKIDFTAIDSKEFDRALMKLKLKSGMKFKTIDKNIREALEQSKGLAIETVKYSKDPVNLATGNFSYEKADLEILGSYP